MGRTEKSQGLAPPAIRKDVRAKQARNIINKVIPAILASNTRARLGADSSELIADPGPASSNDAKKLDEGGDDVAYVKRKGQGRRKAKDTGALDDEDVTGEAPKRKVKKSGKRRNDSLDENMASLMLNPHPGAPTSPKLNRKTRIVTTDSLTAAQMLAPGPKKQVKKSPNVCILNMASPLRPGGGVLAGATSQEEFLCGRTTLLTSLKESFYRLPELGGIYTTDVLVVRSPGPLGDSIGELGPSDRYWIDVISAGMLRFPDLEGEEDEVKTLAKKDRDMVESKMRAVLRMAMSKGVKKLVLGAWGCGAYGNPVADIAQAWNRVLSGKSSSSGKKAKAAVASETWPNLEEVIFAISSPRMAADFAKAYGESIEVESGLQSYTENDEDGDEEEKITQELQTKIAEMESQLSKVWNADLKSRLGTVLDGLKTQLKTRQNAETDSDGDDIGSGDEDEHSDTDEDGNGVQMGSGNGESDMDENDENDEGLDTESSDEDSGVAVKP
ncbi:hypothetical protein N0V94_001950 [Neodidymelliopsis sp. IMI 364377]|nr:hypothetical protein N0V94_001950 [Neodidymelliopsis sp. IMI 364377]